MGFLFVRSYIPCFQFQFHICIFCKWNKEMETWKSKSSYRETNSQLIIWIYFQRFTTASRNKSNKKSSCFSHSIKYLYAKLNLETFSLFADCLISLLLTFALFDYFANLNLNLPKYQHFWQKDQTDLDLSSTEILDSFWIFPKKFDFDNMTKSNWFYEKKQDISYEHTMNQDNICNIVKLLYKISFKQFE